MNVNARTAGRGPTANWEKHQLSEYGLGRPVSMENATADALGFLLLYLIGRDLPQVERDFGWRLAERWERQSIGARLMRGVA